MDVNQLKDTLIRLVAVLQMDLTYLHTQNCSSMKKTCQTTHNLNKVTTMQLVESIAILNKILTNEALYIKSLKPRMNVQSKFAERILKIME